MSVHKEIAFETDICAHLAANGWLCAEGDAAKYDRTRALFPDDTLAWVQAAQPDAWQALQKNHGSKAADTLLDRVRAQLDQRGTLDVLRHGVEMLGLRRELKLAEFKPALAVNPDILARYQQNRLRVVRQVHFSREHSKDSIDLVLFVNGLPVATLELKTDFTQSVQDAIDQYRYDRVPRANGMAEPLLTFPSGALVHFAVSNREVHMTTRLDGPATVFLPFNQGDHGGMGNPVTDKGHRTAYLWEQVLQRDSLLEILGRYLIARRDPKQQITQVLFPRFHQLDVTRKLLAAVRRDGRGAR